VWNKQPLVNGKPPLQSDCPGTQEALRECSAARQASVVRIRVGSNTSILGLGNDAKIINGTLLIGSPGAAASSTCTSSAGAGGAGGAVAGGAGGAAAGGAAAGGAAAGGAAGAAGSSTGGTAGASGGGGTTSTPPPGADNVVVRNITFQDAFDFFPQWTPTDSYTAPPAAAVASALDPKCQATYDATTDNGPHQCRGGRWNSEYDNISIMNATHVWVDHCTFNDGSREDHLYPSVWEAPYVGHDFIVEHHDGLVDVTLASDFVTLSYNEFQNHDKTNLLGGSDKATREFGFGALSVTLHHNYWENAGQRLPRVRFGRVHSYNNYVTGQLLPKVVTASDLAKVPSDNPVTYAMGIGYLAKLYSEANVFEITAFPGDPPADQSAAYFLWHKASPTSGTGLDVNEKTYFFDAGSTLNGAATDLFAHAQAAAAAANPPKPALVSTDSVWKPASSYSYTAVPAAEVKAQVLAKAGAGKL
jgi:pectate lyase